MFGCTFSYIFIFKKGQFRVANHAQSCYSGQFLWNPNRPLSILVSRSGSSKNIGRGSKTTTKWHLNTGDRSGGRPVCHVPSNLRHFWGKIDYDFNLQGVLSPMKTSLSLMSRFKVGRRHKEAWMPGTKSCQSRAKKCL
jgi:hypothetical protein